MNYLYLIFPGFLLLSLVCVCPTYATDLDMIDILRQNNVISQQQHDELKQKIANKNDVRVSLDTNGYRLTSNDGKYMIKIGTRLHFDVSSQHGDLPPGTDATNGTELRRARIEAKGRFNQDYSWVAEVDFADNEVGVKDFWLGYTASPNTRFMIGHQKQPFSLSVEMSSNDIPFIERSIDNYLIIPFIDRALGLRIDYSTDHWFTAAGLFGEGVDPNTDDDEGIGAAIRLVFAPIIQDNQVLHFGGRAAMRSPPASLNAFRIRDETTHLSNLTIVDTGVVNAVEHAALYGFESAVVMGPFSAGGEYNVVKLDRDDLSDLDFASWHVYGTWSLTGESRASAYRISAGEFKRLMPACSFDWDNNTWGALEFATRYAYIDLNDGQFTGGEETVLTSSLNWYLNANVRLMFEWSKILETDQSTVLREEAQGLNIFQFRTQFTF